MPVRLMDAVPLLGYMDRQYARWFLTKRCLLPETSGDIDALIDRCQAAARARGPTHPKPEIVDLQEDAVLSAFRGDGRIRDVTKGMPWSLAEVEIDALVSLQKYVDVTYSEDALKKFDLEKRDDRIRLCLTATQPARDAELFQARELQLFAIKSAGTDLRVEESQVNRRETGETEVTFKVGWGHPFVVVFKVGDRYILNNGYHRAYALRKAGIKQIPCVLVQASDYESLHLVGEPSQFGPEMIMGENPPLFSAFFDSSISPAVKMRPFSTAIVIRPTITSLESETLDGYFSNQARKAPEEPPMTLEYTDLNPRFEDWSVYLLEDGTLLKLRAVVTLGRRLADGTLSGAMVSDHLWVTNARKGKKGPPSPPLRSSEELNGSIVNRNMRFTTVKEPMNEYVTDKAETVFLTLRLLTVSKTSRYDPNGDPTYVITFARDLILA